MALERVFEDPRTLRRLRSGPIGKLLEGFCNWLLEHGFRRGMGDVVENLHFTF